MANDLANPVYCVSCKKQIQADAQFCPYCGFGQSQPAPQPIITPEAVTPTGVPPVRAEYLPEPTRKPLQGWTKAMLVLLVLAGIGSCIKSSNREPVRDPNWEKQVAEHNRKALTSLSNPPAPTPTPTPPPLAKMPTFSQPQTRQVDQALLARINAVGNIVAENGGTMTVQMSTVRVTIPGGKVDEYSAMRLAKMVGDRIGSGMTVRVYDDVGLERAKYTAW